MAETSLQPGYFISFEGIDGSGKSLMIKKLSAALQERGFAVLLTREPGGSDLGRALRKTLLRCDGAAPDIRTETLLFAADRAQHVAQVIRPALAAGQIVLCDRFADSLLAYQGYGRGLALAELQALNRYATAGLSPDLTLLLDLTPAQAQERLRRRHDRMEREKSDFFARVAAGYRTLAQQEPQRIRVIDAARPVKEVYAQVCRALPERLQGDAAWPI